PVPSLGGARQPGCRRNRPMSRLWSWLWRFPAGRPTIPRVTRTPRARVGVEILEDRLAPSASIVKGSWRSARFHVDDAIVSAPTPIAMATAATYSNQSFGTLIGLDQVYAESPDRGAGYSVAVLDTGIDYNHPDLGDGWGKRVVAGWDFVNNDADP